MVIVEIDREGGYTGGKEVLEKWISQYISLI